MEDYAAEPVASGDALHVSRKPGVWSVILAVVASPVGAGITTWILAAALSPWGGFGDPVVDNAFAVAGPIQVVVLLAAAAAAIVLGVISIRASRARGLPGRGAALTLGVIGIVIGTFSGAYNAWGLTFIW